MDESADPRLIALMLAGDQQAFAILIERYESMAQHLAVQFTGNQEVARELVQEASVQAYLSLDHLRDTSRFKSWFYGITLNVCRSYQRGQKLHQVSLEALLEEQSFIEIGFPDSEVDPQEFVVEQELHSLMLQAITLLSPKNRSVILLFYYEQLSLREIATTLGISVVAVKSRLKQARKALRERLLQMYPELRPVSQGRKRRIMQKVTIANVIQQDPYSIAVLVDTNGQRALPLWIGYWEGQAITSMLQNLPTPGPLSFTLMIDLLQAAESILEEVRLETLKDNILYAVIRLRHGKTIKKVEARSSDALALAAQTNSPLSVADDIWNSMSIELTQAQTKPSQQELERILRIMREKRPLDFTQEGAIKQILSYAQEESQRFQHNYIGTEHLLLGLLHEPESRAVGVLQSLNLNVERIRSVVEAVLAPGDGTVIGAVGLTPRAKKAVELALDDARLLDQHAPSTEHVLLGLIREGEGIAARVLQSLGVRYKDVLVRLL